MEFYLDKFLQIKELKKLGLSEISRKADISRVTLWRIEKGEIVPKEKYVRIIAKTLGIGVEEISSLPSEAPVTDKDLSEEKKLFKKWISFDDTEEGKRTEAYTSILNSIQDKFSESDRAIKLIKTLINFSDVMLYVKDHKQKYMAASKAFLELVSMPNEFSISGKTDADIFGEEDGRLNTEEDRRVLLSAISIKNREDYIPGSRKKKFGLISKIPTFDSKGKLTGLIGSFLDITQRKKTEFLSNDLKRCIEFLENRIIWLGTGKLRELKNKTLCPKEIIYLSNTFRRAGFEETKTSCSYDEQLQQFDEQKETSVSFDIEKLKIEGFSTIYYRMKSFDAKEVINCISSVYYIKEYDLYFGITELDIAKNFADLLLNDVKGLNLDDSQIEKLSKMICSCGEATRARTEYDKYENMKDSQKN